MGYWLQLSIEQKPTGKAGGEDVVSNLAADNWLKNNNPMLSDIPIEQLTVCVQKNATIHAKTIKLTCNDQGCFIQADNGVNQLQTGDIIENEQFLTRVQVNKKTKVRQTDLAVFGMEQDSISVFTPADGSLLLSKGEPVTAESDQTQIENPLGFLSSPTQKCEDVWLSSSQALLSEHHLRSAFEPPVYREKSSLSSASEAVMGFTSGESSMIYADMKEKKPKLQAGHDSPLDEISSFISEKYDAPLNEQASLHRHINELPTQASQHGTNSLIESQEKMFQKIKRKFVRPT